MSVKKYQFLIMSGSIRNCLGIHSSITRNEKKKKVQKKKNCRFILPHPIPHRPITTPPSYPSPSPPSPQPTPYSSINNNPPTHSRSPTSLLASTSFLSTMTTDSHPRTECR